MKIIVFSFDIPLKKASFRVKIWRALKKIGAKKMLGSNWVLPYSKSNLNDLKRIAREIKKNKGKTKIIVGKMV